MYDENRKLNKDFECEKELLVDSMKYFEKYLRSSTSLDDIDISVHCDVKIFEWLMKYIKATIDRPPIEVKNVISILISSEFLQMPKLIDQCIDFFVLNIHDVVRLPIDMNCLSNDVLNKVASKVPVEQLDTLKDRKDRLTSRLFQRKLDKLIKETPTIQRCVYCDNLFSEA